jgi:DNA-binding NarL/FixJ family response regulator
MLLSPSQLRTILTLLRKTGSPTRTQERLRKTWPEVPTRSWLGKMAKRAAIPLEKPGRKVGTANRKPTAKWSPTRAEVMRLHAAGLKPAQIAESVKRTPALVRHYLREAATEEKKNAAKRK